MGGGPNELKKRLSHFVGNRKRRKGVSKAAGAFTKRRKGTLETPVRKSLPKELFPERDARALHKTPASIPKRR